MVLAHEAFLGLHESLEESFLGVQWESRLVSYYVVEVVAEEFGTAVSAVAVEDRKEGGLLDAGTQRLVWLRAWLLEV